MNVIDIGSRLVGPGHPCLVIAEAGVNHNGSLDRALAMVDAAQEAGASAVKFQAFRTARLVTRAAGKAAYQERGTPRGQSQYEMLKGLELSAADFGRIADHCRARNILFLSTPFDEESARLLKELGVPAFKVASGEITNLALLRGLARRRLPIILSTGMASLAEVAAAVDTIRRFDPGLILLQCVSNYPAAPADVNLRAMRTMARVFGVATGYSDHTEGIEIALAAVALGACVIEKHFTLDRGLDGPDHRASVEPLELARLVASIRTVESALGDGRKVPARSEAAVAAVARRRIVAARFIPAGTVLAEEMTALLRADGGLEPADMARICGRALAVDVAEGTGLTEEMLR